MTDAMQLRSDEIARMRREIAKAESQRDGMARSMNEAIKKMHQAERALRQVTIDRDKWKAQAELLDAELRSLR